MIRLRSPTSSPPRRHSGAPLASYLLGIVALSVGCASPAPAAEGPVQPAPAVEIARLEAENRSLQVRIDELEADRDRLRAKLPEEKPAGANPAGETDESERLPSVSGLPVVKLVPSPKASGPEVMEAEEVEKRPVLRVHGEEEGAFVTDDKRPRGKSKS